MKNMWIIVSAIFLKIFIYTTTCCVNFALAPQLMGFPSPLKGSDCPWLQGVTAQICAPVTVLD